MSLEKARMQRIAGLTTVGQLHESIGGYVDIMPIREMKGRDWEISEVLTIAEESLEQSGESSLYNEVEKWIEKKLGGPENDKNFIEFLNDENGSGREELGKAIIDLFKQENDENLDEDEYTAEGMNDDDSEDPFPSIQKGDSVTSDPRWEYEDDEVEDISEVNDRAYYEIAEEAIDNALQNGDTPQSRLDILTTLKYAVGKKIEQMHSPKGDDSFIQAQRDAVGAKGSEMYEDSDGMNEKKAPEVASDKPEKKYSSTDKRGYMDKLGKGKSNKLTGKAAERPYMGGANAVKKEAKGDRPSSLQESLKPSGELRWKL